MEQWVLAFAGGAAYEGDGNPLAGVDAHAVWAWIDNKCRGEPLWEIVQAIEAFIREHPGP